MDINTCQATTEVYRELALYSHLIPAIATLVLGIFAFVKAPNRSKATYFLAFAAALTAWLVFDLVVWTSNNYSIVAAFWEPLDYFEILFFLLLAGFIVYDLFPQWSRFAQPILLIGAIFPLIVTFFGDAVFEMNQPVCEMVGNNALAIYKAWLEGIVLTAVFFMGLLAAIRKGSSWTERIRIALIVLSAVFFMGIFGGSEYVATSTDFYEINLYALFALPLFVLSLTIAITSYGTLKLGDFATRTLFYVFLILAATQFFFAGDMTVFLLAAMSFSVVLILGLMLFFASEREMRQRIQIQKQEKELELVNRQQEGLLHFISHEVKGFLTSGQNAFAGIIEGDYGQPTPQIRTLSQDALGKMRQGVETVMDILDASNLKKGTVMYKHIAFDLKKAVEDSVETMRPIAATRGLTLDLTIDSTKEYKLVGDREKFMQHVIRNLIDNAIRYTPKGSIHVTLTRGDTIRFSVKDTGVGITAEDMSNLFTEGGHGKDSIKVNVDSTGYGLYIAKEVTQVHGGRIWAESAGAGKGSEFIVELRNGSNSAI